MMYITLPESLKSNLRSDKRTTITSDETWAFTEERRKDDEEERSAEAPRIEAHDLFNLFTASIIQAKTDFIR